ncbi:MAG TPA: hypothetical protein VNE63_09995 [Candidatus Acidoferrales bacterium]|nr:hypothetical protein [Candidatus Acidoferrales bacterium]
MQTAEQGKKTKRLSRANKLKAQIEALEDSILCVNLSDPQLAEQVLAAYRVRLAEPETDYVCLHLVGDHGRYSDFLVEEDDTVKSLRAKLDSACLDGYTTIELHKT